MSQAATTDTGRRVTLVAARARNGVIGDDAEIPWHLPADFAHFKRVTIGHPLILGRTTFEGIGRPLPGRTSIVLTSDRDWSYPGVLVARGIEEALDLGFDLDPEVMVGGGGAVYRAAMEHATHQILSEIDVTPDGDTHYPEFDEAEWIVTRREPHPDDEVAWEIRWLERKSPALLR